MKYCPKCQSFYDDASLAFCLTDGIPLIEINQSNALWSEGAKSVETSRRIIQKQTRRQKLQRISRILITTVMMIMVISVVAMNIYLYFPTNEVEKAENASPTPMSEPTRKMPVIVQTIPSPKATATPKRTLTPIHEEKDDDDKKGDEKKDVQPQCSKDESTSSISNIKNSFFDVWRNNALKHEDFFKRKFAEFNQIPRGEINIDINFQREMIKVVPNSNCQKASVSIRHSWLLRPVSGYQIKEKIIETVKTYNCNKSGNAWKCI